MIFFHLFVAHILQFIYFYLPYFINTFFLFINRRVTINPRCVIVLCHVTYEQHREKTCLRSFQSGVTQTGLKMAIDTSEMSDFGSRGIVLYM